MLLLKISITCFISAVMACNFNGNSDSHQNENPTAKKLKDTGLANRVTGNKKDTLFEKKKLIFKNWLADTLKCLDTSIASFNSKAKTIREEVVLTSDSLGLSVNSFYNVSFYTSAKPELADAQKLLSLLKEYDEYPKGQFVLKFKTTYFFTPSPVPELPYDMTFDMEDVQVIEKDGKKVSRYDVVRGRIGSKHMTTLLENGIKKEEYINYLWKDGELVKQKN